MLHWGLGPIIVCSNDELGLTLTYFITGSNFVTDFSKGKCVNNVFF